MTVTADQQKRRRKPVSTKQLNIKLSERRNDIMSNVLEKKVVPKIKVKFCFYLLFNKLTSRN